MPAPIRIHLTPEEDRLLLQLSKDPGVHPKTRKWALMVRLAGTGWTAPRIARFLGLDPTGVRQVLRRFLREGLPGLAYRKPPGAKAKVTDALAEGQTHLRKQEEIRAFLRTCLAEERTWTISQLREAVWEQFGLWLGHNTLHRHLRGMGYVWKRTRYVPAGRPSPEEEAEFRRAEAEAKRGQRLG